MSLKIAIAGTGNVARKQYIPYLASVEDVSLGYYNRTAVAAQEIVAAHGGELFASLEDLALWKPDAVLVLTSETCRDEVATALIELGAPRLFFEKPLVARNGQAHVSEEDFVRGREVIHLAEKRGCETAMVFNYRFFDHAVQTVKLIEERNLGSVVGVYGAAHYACWSHCIDLMLFLAGDVTELSGSSGTTVRSFYDAVDVTAAFRLAGGGAGTLVGTCGWSLSTPLYDMTFLFEHGRIRVQDLDGPLDLIAGDGDQIEHYSPGANANRWASYDRSFQRSLAAYLESLRTGGKPPVPGIAGLRELQFEAALKRSIAEGRRVQVQEEFAL
ncbi:MAG: Gfo/Idh/MocA family oxidoreductase [Capsulimonadaceae bacterium]|nr:Gfo/Idh/MocA family oxidoreductase [Capsulimonadaceae bacterium]